MLSAGVPTVYMIVYCCCVCVCVCVCVGGDGAECR